MRSRSERNESEERLSSTTRFVEAVKLLTEEHVEAQLGGIYSLESLANDAPGERARVRETLCGFVREHGKRATTGDSLSDDEQELRQGAAVQAAVAVLARIPRVAGRLDLRRTSLTRVEVRLGALRFADFTASDLRRAVLDELESDARPFDRVEPSRRLASWSKSPAGESRSS